jgi:hypothetical protein
MVTRGDRLVVSVHFLYGDRVLPANSPDSIVTLLISFFVFPILLPLPFPFLRAEILFEDVNLFRRH